MKKNLLILCLLIAVAAGCEETQRRAPIAGGYDGELSRCLKLSSKKKYEEAVNCLEVFKSRYPGGEQAASADLMIADNYMRQREYTLAAESYNQFIQKYPNNRRVDYAYYQSGEAYLKDNPKSVDRDQKSLEMAVQNLTTLVNYFPESNFAKTALPTLREAKTKLAYRSYRIAKFYYNYNEYISAMTRFEEVVTRYGGSIYDEKSFYYLIHSLKKTRQLEGAQKALQAFEQRYPASDWLKKAKGDLKS